MKSIKSTKSTASTRTISDGWHTVSGYRVYVEDGYIKRGLASDGQRPLYVYRACLKRLPLRYGDSVSRVDGWDRVCHITPTAFRAGVRRGTIAMY